MKKFIRISIMILRDVIKSVSYFIENNLRNSAKFLNYILPYVMY